jgi:hypothetical protein
LGIQQAGIIFGFIKITMKKTLALAIGLILATSLAACGKDDSIIPPPHQTSAQSRGQARTEESPIINGDWRSAIPINDPALLRDIHDFTYQCYASARSHLIHPTAKDKPQLTTEQIADTQWIGSEFFLAPTGLYNEISVYPYSDILDIAMWPSTERTARETTLLQCADWWKNEKYGIYSRLLKTVKNKELLTRIGYWFEPLPKLKTTADFQQFLEQGATCRSSWSDEMVINHIPPQSLEIEKMREDSLKALEVEAQKVGFTAELIPPEAYTGVHPKFTLHPKNQKFIAFGAEVEKVNIDQELGFFEIVLNANVAHIRERIAPLGFKVIPSFVAPYDGVVGSFLQPPENYIHSGMFIDVKTLCEPSQTNPDKNVCQENKTVVGCFLQHFYQD